MAEWFFAAAAAFQVAGGAEQYRVQQLGIEANISQLGSNAATLAIDKQLVALRREAGRSTASSQQELFGVERDLIGKSRGFVNLQAEQEREGVSLNKRSFETRRLAERANEAFQRGQIRLGIASSTAKARIETASASFIQGLGKGQTAFTRGFSQSGINDVSTANAQLQAAKLRGILTTEEAVTTREQFGLQLGRIDLNLERGLTSLFGREQTVDIRSQALTTSEEFAEREEVFTQEKLTEQRAETLRQQKFEKESRAEGPLAEISEFVGGLF